MFYLFVCVKSVHNKLTEIMRGGMKVNISLLCDVIVRQVIFLTLETAQCVSKREEGDTTKTRKKKKYFPPIPLSIATVKKNEVNTSNMENGRKE